MIADLVLNKLLSRWDRPSRAATHTGGLIKGEVSENS